MASRPFRVRRGRPELIRLLEEATDDVRCLDLAGFRRWLGVHLERWRGDPVFQQQVRIRELRRAHPELPELERRLRAARAGDARSPASSRLQAIERELHGACRAVEGLRGALAGADPQDRPALRHKLEGFLARVASLRDEQRALIRATPERVELLRLQEELERVRREIGLDVEEAHLTELQRARGRGSGRTGRGFEDAAADAVARYLIPELASAAGPAAGSLRVLRGVTLGAARTEIDQLVVRLAEPSQPVQVLALVEAKRNVNDLAHGFRQRLENLAWIAGDPRGHDPAAYRTRRFPTGRFDRPVVHEQDGERFQLAPKSFSLFARPSETAPELDRFFLVTRRGSIWGMGSAALARLAHRVATDPAWDPSSDAYLLGLLEWTRSLTHPVEASDVLRAFAASEDLARRVLLLDD